MSGVVNVRTKATSKTAIHWTEENIESVLKFLADKEIGYTFHEINSGGQLIIYTGVGPVQVPFGCWIVFDDLNQVGNCESNEAFTRSYDVLEGTEDNENNKNSTE